MRTLTALTLTAALVVAAAPAGANRAHRPCTHKGSTTVASSKSVRVYKVANKQGGDNLFGCVRAGNIRRLLAQGYDDGLETSGVFDHVRLAGRFVAWQYTATDLSCKADCPQGYDPTQVHLTVRDLRTKKNETVTGELASRGARLVLTKGGAIGWSEDDPLAIKAFDGDGARTLDTGEGVAPGSLRLSGRTASWKNGGERKTATLKPRT